MRISDWSSDVCSSDLDEGDVVRYYNSASEILSDLLFESWYAASEDPIKRWSVMEYDVKDGEFSVSFKYPDEMNVEQVDARRREAALLARYGEKPVIYPPPPQDSLDGKSKT